MSINVKITVADPSVVIRSGIIAVLKRQTAFRTELCEIEDMDALRQGLAHQSPDILLVNPASVGMYPLHQIRKDAGRSDMKCVALQTFLTDAGGLKGFDETISIYDSAETICDKLARLMNDDEQDRKHESLSQREKEVIACVIKGMTNKQIADHLYISAHTVITHRRNISTKLGIHSSAGLAIYAIVNKLVELNDVRDTVQDEEE